MVEMMSSQASVGQAPPQGAAEESDDDEMEAEDLPDIDLTKADPEAVRRWAQKAQNMTSSDDLDNDIEDILQDFESKSSREILHTVLFY